MRGSRKPEAGGWAVLAALLLAVPAAGAAWPPENAQKLDARLLAVVAAGTTDSLPVWVEFQDKGEDGPAGLARMLADARAALAPRALARRLRAHVSPLVDYRDLPVSTPYLDVLVAHGMRPYGLSRWFNRAAVRIPPARLADLAALPFVQRLVPVERGTPMRELPAGPLARPGPPAAGTLGASGTAVDYGLTSGEIGQLNLTSLHDMGYTGTGVLISASSMTASTTTPSTRQP